MTERASGRHAARASRACDRCGTADRLVHLIAWPLGDETYWLCQQCINAVILVWLAEHKQLIVDNRQKRRIQGRREEVEPGA